MGDRLSPVPRSIFLLHVKNIILRTETKSWKNSCKFKIWMGSVGQILIKFPRLSFRFFQLPFDILLGVTLKNQVDLNMNGVGGTNIDKVGNFFHSRFSAVSLWCPLGSNLSKHADGHSVTTEACTSLTQVCVVWRSGSALKLSALWRLNARGRVEPR